MNEIWTSLTQLASAENVLALTRATVTGIVGLLAARIAASTAARLLAGHLDRQHTALVRRGSYHGVLILFVLAALHQVGFDLSVILGAAGIFSVAIGFASQTSASNLVSGLFLLAERPFEIGDVITISGTTGEVLSIDLLSVKLRTHDNLFVRIPNESLIKSEVRTLTRFPIRRADCKVSVAYREDLERVRTILFEVADRDPLCLDEPKPLFILLGFADSGIDIQFSVWAERGNFLEMRTGIQLEIKRAFDEAGIEIPFPHRSLFAGSTTGPLPVQLVNSTPQATPCAT